MNNFRRKLFGEIGTLTLSAYSSSVSNSGSTTFTVYWNNEVLINNSINVSSNVSWASPTWDSSTGLVSIQYTSNTTLSSRSATIIVTYKGQSLSYSLTQGAGTLSISPSSQSVVSDAGNTSFTVYVGGSKYTGSISISFNTSGLTYSNSSGSITVYYPENTGSSSKTMSISVSASGKSASATIYQENYIRTITSFPSDGTIGGYSYVTIGGLKWATRDYGASSPQSLSSYRYRWAETATTSYYNSWTNYKYGTYNSSDTVDYGMTKYNGTDGKEFLDSSDDVAATKMGNSWRMPTLDEARSLINNTTHERVKYKTGSTFDRSSYYYGHALISTSNSSKFIFFRDTNGSNNSPVEIWTSKRHATNLHYANYFTGGGGAFSRMRYEGMRIRGVHD